MGVLSQLKKLVYPPRCAFCGEVLEPSRAPDGLCRRCLVELPYTGSRFSSRGEFFSACVSPLYYSGAVSAAVKRFKFGGKVSYARVMGRMIAESASEHGLGGADVITWVPVSLRRLRKRGYSQAKLLAKEAAGRMGLPCARLLRKRRDTPPQSALASYSMRKANVSGAFAAVNEAKIKGRRVLLIDDVFTSGATASECARILLMAGAQSVSCATLCRARRKDDIPKKRRAARLGEESQ